MGLFSKIIKLVFGEPRKINDEFFGEMTDVDGYYECWRDFKPINKSIEIGIEAGEAGPTSKQKEFFSSIETDYDEITKKIQPVIEAEFRNWKRGFKIFDFKKEFKPVYLWVPSCESLPISWEIAFETDHDLNHIFTVSLKDKKIENLRMDG